MSKDLPIDNLSNTGLHVEVLGQYKAMLIGTWYYWVSTKQY